MDVESFEALYRQHHQDVYRFALNLSGDAALAEDIAADTFVRAWTAPGQIRAATVKSYLITTARHLYVDEIRRTRRLVNIAPDTAQASEQSSEKRAELNDQLQRTLTSLQKLAESDRAALIMRVFDDLPYEDIAVALGTSVTAAKVRVHRARLRLAELCQEKGD